MAESPEDLQEITTRLETQCTRYGLTINVTKAKTMKFGRTNEDVRINLTTGRLEQVEEFKYLGAWFTQGGDSFRAVQERIRLGLAAMNKLSKIWKDRTIS